MLIIYKHLFLKVLFYLTYPYTKSPFCFLKMSFLFTKATFYQKPVVRGYRSLTQYLQQYHRLCLSTPRDSSTTDDVTYVRISCYIVLLCRDQSEHSQPRWAWVMMIPRRSCLSSLQQLFISYNTNLNYSGVDEIFNFLFIGFLEVPLHIMQSKPVTIEIF